MANKLWSDWYDGVLPELPGLPEGTPADFYIRRAAIEFCKRSQCWRQAIPAFNATAATGVYTLANPVTGAMVAKVLELRFLGRELLVKTPEWLDDKYGPGQDWRTVTADPPVYYTTEQPNKVTIVPFPISTTASALTGFAALMPTDDSTGLDEVIWREHFDDVAKLAKAVAMESAKKPYSNTSRAQQLRKEVDSAIGFVGYNRARGGRGTYRTKTHWN